MSLDLTVRDRLAGRAPYSLSHAIATQVAEAAKVESAAEGGVALDRDVVVRWVVGAPEVGLSLAAAPGVGKLEGEAFGVVTLVPPSVEVSALPRDLIVLLDTSGSMMGEPLEQARRVALAPSTP